MVDLRLSSKAAIQAEPVLHNPRVRDTRLSNRKYEAFQ